MVTWAQALVGAATVTTHPMSIATSKPSRSIKKSRVSVGRSDLMFGTALLTLTPRRCSGSAHRLLHESDDPLLVGSSQLLQREVGRPHVAVVEICLVAETERGVPRLELVRALVEAD